MTWPALGVVLVGVLAGASGCSEDTLPPSTPTNLVATRNNSTGFVLLSWQVSQDNVGVKGYWINRDGMDVEGASTNSFLDAAAETGPHCYSVSAYDEAGNRSAASNKACAISGPDSTKPKPPTQLTATAGQDGKYVTLDWIAATDDVGVVGYRIDRAIQGQDPNSPAQQIQEVSTTTYTDTDVPVGVTVCYTVKAFDDAGNLSEPSNSSCAKGGRDKTPPSAPSGLSATPSASGEITLSWGAATDDVGVVKYLVFRDAETTEIGSTTETTYKDTGLTAATKYCYTVKAVDAAQNTSLASSEACATTPSDIKPPSDPNDLRVYGVGPGEMRLSWSPSSDDFGVTGYYVLRGEADGAKVSVATATDTKHLDSGLKRDTKYCYQVVAFDAANNLSGPSNEACATTGKDVEPPSTPGDPNAQTGLVGEIKLSWQKSTDNVGVIAYRIYRDRASEKLAETSKTSYVDRGLSGGSQHCYTVVAFDAAGNVSIPTDEVCAKAGRDSQPPTEPGPLAAAPAGDGEIRLSWAAATDDVGVMGYRVNRDGVMIGTTAEVFYLDSGLVGGSHHCYQIVAFDQAGNVSLANDEQCANAGGDALAPTAPGDPNAVPGETVGTINLTWTAATDNVGVLGYRIYRDHAADKLAETAELLFVDQGLQPGSVHNYVVKAFDAAGNVSPPSKEVVGVAAGDKTKPTKPTNVVVNPGDAGCVNITWSPSTDNVGVDHYDVYRGSSKLGSPTTTAFQECKLTPNTSYCYTVKALDASGNVSDASDQGCGLSGKDVTPPVGAELRVYPSETSMSLIWTPATDNVAVTGYSVTRNGQALHTEPNDPLPATTTSYLDQSGLQRDTKYCYIVVARDAAGNLGQSNEACATTGKDTQPPTTPGDPNVQSGLAGEINLSWAASTDNVGVAVYRVYRDSGSTPVGEATASSFIDRRLQPASRHCYTVDAVDAAGNVSRRSPEACGYAGADTTAPTKPRNVIAVTGGENEISLSWAPATDDIGVVGYEIWRDAARVGTSAGLNYLDRGLVAASQHCYQVKAYDAAWNFSGPEPNDPNSLCANAGGQRDIIKPSIPQDLQATPTTFGRVALSWTASTDNVGVVGYDINRDGRKVGTATGTTYVDQGLRGGTTYKYTVQAFDAAGNYSNPSAEASVTIQPPSIGQEHPSHHGLWNLTVDRRGISTAYDGSNFILALWGGLGSGSECVSDANCPQGTCHDGFCYPGDRCASRADCPPPGKTPTDPNEWTCHEACLRQCQESWQCAPGSECQHLVPDDPNEWLCLRVAQNRAEVGTQRVSPAGYGAYVESYEPLNRESMAPPLVAYLSSGRYLVVWAESADLYDPSPPPPYRIWGQFILPQTGKPPPLAEPFQIGQRDSQVERYEHSWISVAGSNTDFLVVWRDHVSGANPTPTIYGRFVSSGGELMPSGPAPYPLSKVYGGSTPSVVYGGGKYLVVWSAAGDIAGRLLTPGVFDPNSAPPDLAIGTALSNCPDQLSGWSDLVPADIALYGGRYFMPNLRLAPPSAAHGGDGYLVVWNENTSACGVDYNLRGQRLSMTGVNLGQPIAINSAANMQALPTVAFDGEKYLVTWTDGRAGIPSVEPCPTSPPAPGWCFACPGGLPGVNVYGQFVGTTGELLYATGQPEFLIPISVRDNLRSTVAFGGGKYLLTWNVLGEFSGTAIWETYWATMNP